MTKKEHEKRRRNYRIKTIIENKKIGDVVETNLVQKDSSKTNLNSGKFAKNNNGNLPKKNRRLPDIKRLENEVLQCIIGQDMQVRQIITSIYRAKKFKSIKSNVLIIGKSGTGKTATVKEIAKRLHLPYTIEDATKYTQEGYVGADVEDMLYNLLENANGDVQRAQNGIIIDEIDKKSGTEGFGERDVSGSEVLKSLLKIIEGTVVKLQIGDEWEERIVDFDTKNIIIVFLGAFSGLDKIRDKRLKAKQLGFVSQEKTTENKPKTRFLKQDLVSYGMPEEFVGRIDTIIEMNELTKNDLALILRNSKLSIFRKYQSELRELGISLDYDGKLFEVIAEESLALDTGARELSNTVNRIFENISYDIFSNKKNYTKCKLSLDIVKDNTKYELS